MKRVLTLTFLFLSSSLLYSQSITIGTDGTVRCKGVSIGTTQSIFGDVYEVVDRNLLIQRRNEGKDLTKVCVSNVTDMNNLFYNNTQFNQPIGNWDVSSVTNMSGMFRGDNSASITSFNQPIGNWDVSSVTNMSGMFQNSMFNQPIGSWNVIVVSNMSNMFNNSQFDQDIGNWNVSSVQSMNLMFTASKFNQPIGNWDVSSVKNMNRMFSSSVFNYPIGDWEVRNVTDMSGMFWGSQFNHPIDDWDVSSVTRMSSMFRDSKFNQSLSSWNVSSVQSMGEMFRNSVFNEPINSWIVSSVTSMGGMFRESKFNQPIGDWNVSQVTDMTLMFLDSKFNQPIGDWDVSSVTSMNGMFFNSPFNQPLHNWDVSSVSNMNEMFRNSYFNQPIGSWNVSNVKDMQYMFLGSQFNQPIGEWNVSRVTTMSSMFQSSPFNQPIGSWDVSSVTNMSGMFELSPFNQPINRWCVSQLLVEPHNFSSKSPMTSENKPVWGTCYKPKPISQLFPLNNTLDLFQTIPFSWRNDSTSTKYNLQVFEGFNPLVLDTLLSDTTFTNIVKFRDNVVHNWRVRGYIDDLKRYGDWSSIRSFTPKKDPVGRVTLGFPTDFFIVDDTTFQFQWMRDLNSDLYTIQVSRDGFSTFVMNISTPDTFITSSRLLYSRQYSWRVRSSNTTGLGEWSPVWRFLTNVDTSIEPEEQPTQFSLQQNYPNPFNPSTQIRFSIPQSTTVRLEVFTITGQSVSVLVNQTMSSGNHTVSFDGSILSSGVYIYKLSTPEFTQSRLMNLIK